ncbi:MAG: serine/threonine-protein kinase [Cyanobacteria bacterium P01_G01_bin.49]
MKSCQSCGSPLTINEKSSEVLPPGTKLDNGLYTVEKKLGQGGFGITYLCKEERLDRFVVLKELFPEGCHRQGSTVITSRRWKAEIYNNFKEKFLKEGQTLARFKHPGIVRVFSYFKENNTAYIVMEYLQGKTLEGLLEERGQPLQQREAISYIEKVCNALEVVHQASFLHRDLKPDNIMITENGQVILIDFGSARQFIPQQTQKFTTILTQGYAPPEQYQTQAKFGSFTDIYALGATLYHLLTGKIPVSAPDRNVGVELKSVKELNPTVRACVDKAVIKAMALKEQERVQSVKDFLNLLYGRKPDIEGKKTPFYQVYPNPWDAFNSQ